MGFSSCSLESSCAMDNFAYLGVKFVREEKRWEQNCIKSQRLNKKKKIKIIHHFLHALEHVLLEGICGTCLMWRNSAHQDKQ